MTAIKNAMDKAAATVPAIVGARDDKAAALILKAGKAAASMLTLCKEAAAIAAKQLNPAAEVPARIGAVVALYAADFAEAGHNVKSLFVDALVLHACAQTPVTVTAIGKDGKKEEKHIVAADAVNLPKHAMKDAAKQAREANGMGRKSGGGAKPKAAAAQPAAVTMSEVDGFSQWLGNLEPYFADAVFHGKIVARMIELGYTVNKAAKGRVIKGAASA
jgi:hypothetical protein